MKGRRATDPAEGNRSGEAIERLVDEVLRSLAQPPAVDLTERVLTAIDEQALRRGRVSPPGDVRAGWPFLANAWRPAAALAGALVVVLAAFFAWQRTDRQLSVAGGRAARTMATAANRSEAAPSPSFTARSSPGGSVAPATHSPTPRRSIAARSARAGRRSVEPAFAQVESIDTTPSSGPYLPGAPAGDLGDPLAPLPTPPSIAFAPIAEPPIASAPPISDIARPVTDFPADNPAPGVPTGTSGKSGGTRR